MSDFWSEPSSTSILHVCEQRRRWRDCMDAPSLVACVISTIISWAGSNGQSCCRKWFRRGTLTAFLQIAKIFIIETLLFLEMYTGDSRYVDFTYLDTITYVEVIFHSQHFFSIYLCSSTPSMSKTVNIKQRVSRGDFSCPRCIFYYICYFLCRSKKSALTRVSYCLFRLCTCITWGVKIFQTKIIKKKKKKIKVIYLLSIEQLILYLAQLNPWLFWYEVILNTDKA